MRSNPPARLIAIMSPWLFLACSSAEVSADKPSSGGVGGGFISGIGGGGGNFLSTGQSEPGIDLGPAPPGCGDGVLTKDERCDDGNRVSGDGCTANCRQVEPGYSCVPAGQLCHRIARCGDGVAVLPLGLHKPAFFSLEQQHQLPLSV